MLLREVEPVPRLDAVDINGVPVGELELEVEELPAFGADHGALLITAIRRNLLLLYSISRLDVLFVRQRLLFYRAY